MRDKDCNLSQGVGRIGNARDRASKSESDDKLVVRMHA